MVKQVQAARVDKSRLRLQIEEKYQAVAQEPEQGFHFHTGRPLAQMLGYEAGQIDGLPAGTVDSFAGTGNPFSMGALQPGERVLDIGCGAGFDSLLAAQSVGPSGSVVGLDMTEAMLDKARRGAEELGLSNIDFRRGYLEELPFDDDSFDVVISNGVVNLTPDKAASLQQIYRVLRPGGRFQIADIVVHKEVPQSAKDDIDLWSG